MLALPEIQAIISKLSNAEKALVLKWVAQDLQGAFAGIESRANINGGEACVVRTRIPVWLLVSMRQAGASEADLLREYPSLRAEDLTNAWAYAHAYPNEIAKNIEQNEAT
jgi:uncharacterized protein (DUF433 family)